MKEMLADVDGIKIYYQRHFGEGLPIILLHGWGGCTITMLPVFDYLLRENRSVICVDLPGFGKSDLPSADFGIYDYAEIIKKFLFGLEIKKAIFVGHSFGGRISIVLGARTELTERIVLVDSAGMKPKRKLSYYISVLKYKRAKKRNKNIANYGSDDYRALPQAMKSVFTRVVNQHLEGELPNIKSPTLIIWGENDKDTPLYMAQRIKKGIKDSGLVVLKNCGHYCYLENKASFELILSEFIRGK